MPDTNPVRWTPDRSASAPPWTLTPLPTALGRGLLGHCPSCGKSHIFNGFLSVVPECRNCGAPLGAARADDAPPYFTILIVGHIVVPLMLWMEKAYAPPMWLHWSIWVPLTLFLSLTLIRPVKGATVGLMLKLGMMKTAGDA